MATGYPRPSCLTRHAILDCSDHSSMNPGDAAWENKPPDSAKVASWASYTALGDERVTTRAEPLYSRIPMVPVTWSLTESMYASRSRRSGSHQSPAYTR